MSLSELIQRAEAGEYLTRRELAELLSAEGEEQKALFHAADRVRRRTMGDGVPLRGIIEFSNICRMDCHYCGIRRSNRSVRRYRIAPELVVRAAENAYDLGYGTVVLQSGEGDAFPPEELAEVVRRIRASVPQLAITLSVGERTHAEYALWREAGADRFLMRHETSDPELFTRLRPGRMLKQRVDCLLDLRSLGYQIGSGFMVGLPGATIDTLAGDIDLVRELNVEMCGIGPFIPAPGTPLACAPGGQLEMTLKCVAVTRLAIPDCHLPATTAIGSINPFGRQLALQVGANVVMPNATPASFRENYQLYPGKICLLEDPEGCAPCVTAMIIGEGRYVQEGPSHSPRQGPWQG